MESWARFASLGALVLLLLTTTPSHAQPAQQVAFSAQLSSDASVLPGATIVFDEVITNEGDRYFGNVGLFVCDEEDEDLYVFYWSLESPVENGGSQQGRAMLMLADTEIKFGPETSIPHYDLMTGSGTSQMTAIARCQPASAFRLVAGEYSEGDTLAEFTAKHSSFTGFKIPDIALNVELTQMTEIIAPGRITFDNVLVDTGDNYNLINSYFECPDNSVYFFTWTIQGKNQTRAAAALMIEGSQEFEGPRTYMIGAENFGPNSGTSSTSSLLKCFQGDGVYIEARGLETTYNAFDPRLTTLTGYDLGDEDALVAFSAYMDTQQAAVMNSTVIYGSELWNLGGNYDNETGEFTCPDDDLYFFTWSVQALARKVTVELVMDDMTVIKSGPTTSYSHFLGDQGPSGTSTMSVVARCEEEAAVSVRFTEQMIDGLALIPTYNTFTGFKLPYQ